MSRQSDIKQTVLQGVYEDNAGIPRTARGKGRRKAHAAQAAGTPHRSRARMAAVIALLGLVALFGINFRLVTVDGSGPVAGQRLDMDPGALPLTVLAGLGDTAAPGNGPPENPGLLHTASYDTMLGRLGMPMADLFNLRVQTIVIDPGHGGIDPGATGHQGLKEKDVVLDVARRLRDRLAAPGKYRVLLTRDSDKKVFLKERVAFAKEQRADLFISIHINSLPPGSEHLNYVETYYFGPHADQRSLELAEQENRDSDYLMGDFREVIARIGDTLKTEESRLLADSIHTRLFDSLRRRNPALLDARSKAGPFVVLLGVDVPSVLVEISCLSNKAEETRLSRAEYRDDIANYLEKGIVDYLEQRAQRRTIERGLTQHVAKQER